MLENVYPVKQQRIGAVSKSINDFSWYRHYSYITPMSWKGKYRRIKRLKPRLYNRNEYKTLEYLSHNKMAAG